MLRDRGLDAAAEPLIRESLAIRRKVFGELHRETATSTNDLALELLQRGDLAGAEALFRQNLATNLRVLGADHPSVGVAIGNLALVLDAQGDAAGAERLYRDDLAILRQDARRRSSRPTRKRSATCRSRCFTRAGCSNRSRRSSRRSPSCGRILRPDHPRVTTYLVNLSRLQLARGEADKAEPTLRHALELRQGLYPAEDWRIAQVKSLLGEALTKQTRYAEAETLLLDAVNLLKPIPGPQAQEAADNRARLASLYAAWRPGRSCLSSFGSRPRSLQQGTTSASRQQPDWRGPMMTSRR